MTFLLQKNYIEHSIDRNEYNVISGTFSAAGEIEMKCLQTIINKGNTTWEINMAACYQKCLLSMP